MMRSLYSGVTGLKNHQTSMDVIGNNLANVNTVGYKASRVVFQDLFSQTTKPASAVNGNVSGGTNPQQIGMGVSIATVDILHTRSAGQGTGNPLDLSIEGEGFFVLDFAGQELYTRAGNFYMDEQSNLVAGPGYYVQGYMYNNPAATGPTAVDASAIDDGTNITGANLTMGTGLGVGDAANGNKGLRVSGTNLNNMYVTFMGVEVTVDLSTTGAKTLDFGDKGTLTFNYNTLFANENDAIQAHNGKNMVYSGALDRQQSTANTVMSNLIIDPSYYDVSVDQSGAVIGLDRATGKEYKIGQIVIATFDNQQALEKLGNNVYRTTVNSGNATYNTAGENGSGTVKAGTLEMSNVDMADEFTKMIVTQRGFQANSRIITTSDSMLEELVNLKR